MGEALPPSAIEGLDMRPWAPLEFSRAWLGKADLVRRNRADLQAAGRLGGLDPSELATLGAALTGELRIPVIAVRYSDVPEPYPVMRLAERLFGQSQGDTVSLTDYWGEVSDGLLRVGGIVTSWVPLRRSARYYLEGERYGWGEFGRVGEFRRHVLELVDPSLDFSDFDNDGPDGIPNSGDDDGFVDFVAFFYATECGEKHDGTIWPHRGAMAPIETNDVAAGGGMIQVADYIILPALDPSSCDAAQIGVLAHETAHAFGLPDLYDYDGSSRGIGSWGLMGTGSHASPHSPAHPSAWAKEQLGWARLDWVGEEQTGWLPAERFGRRILRHDLTDGSGRYLLLERRTEAGSDRDLPGHGLLVWVVDPERAELGIWNEDERRPAVGLLGADETGLLVSTGGQDFSGPFPGRPAPWSGADRFPVRIGQVPALGGGLAIRIAAEASLGWPSGELRLSGVTGGDPVVRAVPVREGMTGGSWMAVGTAPWLRLARNGDSLRLEADPLGLSPGVHRDTVRLVDERTGRTADRLLVRLDVGWSGTNRVLAADLPWSWGLAEMNGALVHAGLGWDALGLRPQPRLLRLGNGEEIPRTLARLPAEGLYSPVVGADGAAYVLARARDRNYVYRVTADGAAEVVATDVGRGPAYGLAAMPDGSLLAAGWSGRLYRVEPLTGEWSLWADLERAVYQIAADPATATVYVALLSGEVLRVEPSGQMALLPTGFDRGKLVAITVAPDGRVFAAERGDDGRIVQVSTAGPMLISTVKGGEFYGLAADGLFLYALDLGNRELLRIPIGGSSSRMLATTPDDAARGEPAGPVRRR